MPKTAKDLMDPEGVTVAPALALEELARRFTSQRLDAACVLDGGKLVGVVTGMDLIFQDKRLHMPNSVTILDAVIPLESRKRTQFELRKMAGSTVADVMTVDVKSVSPQTSMEDVASLMVDRHLSVVPVMDGTNFLGAITRHSMLRAHVG
jgi:CBS domain-containing protein